LLQQSRIPTHLLRKSGKEKNDLLKGKVVVDSLSESKAKTITEKLEKNDELNKKFKRFITEGVWLKQYHLEGQDQEKDTRARAKFIESLTQVSLKMLFSASSGSNCFVSTANNSQFKAENLPLRVKGEKAKKLTESTAFVKWQSENNKKKISETKNLMTETISKLKKELEESKKQREQQEVMELDDLVEVSIDDEEGENDDEKDTD
jgi:gas vesicle protein